MSQSDAEEAFVTYWSWLVPGVKYPYKREFTFARPRRWRFDFAWPETRVAVEIEGGVWSRGRHTRGSGFAKDCEKYNAAVREGWFVLRYTPGMLEEDPAGVVGQILDVIERRKEE